MRLSVSSRTKARWVTVAERRAQELAHKPRDRRVRCAPDKVFEEVRRQYSEKEIIDLTAAAAAAINTWNRLAIAFRVPPQVDRSPLGVQPIRVNPFAYFFQRRT